MKLQRHARGENISPEQFEAIAVRVSMVSIIGNTVLSLLKMLAGILAHSGAMISDAVHSASDVFSSVIVIIGVKISAKDSDKEHPYGHERFECVAAILLAGILLVTALFIGHTALEHITGGSSKSLAIPGLSALLAAILSIVVKEAMYWYTRFYAKWLDSGALMADAWHHRSDALSSVGALIGIAGARMGYPVLDPIASLVICAFILKAACDVFRDAIRKMVDHACDDKMERALLCCAAAQSGVMGVDEIHTRIFGNKIYADIEIQADSQITLAESHAIARQVHNAIEAQFPKVKHILVSVNPVPAEAENTRERHPAQIKMPLQ
ncbi:MAG: cation diffusion facilitator family transporter [Firmicutes bacterium]|nr:cation diffusion facilitator family transporter [Bacillota bacterium]MDY4222255.1 cation diffusion facilitator family transporter [Candidatus Faecousia sp.]MDY6161653.1 cation diffusion facilitator family transporter [Candidatus Faecousia sp.]